MHFQLTGQFKRLQFFNDFFRLRRGFQPVVQRLYLHNGLLYPADGQLHTAFAGRGVDYCVAQLRRHQIPVLIGKDKFKIVEFHHPFAVDFRIQ